MNYIVLELEWNQPYSMKSMIRSPVYLQGEIIQISAVKLDEQFNLLDTFKIMVTPKYYRFMVFPLTDELKSFYLEREGVERAKDVRRMQYAEQVCTC